MTTSDPSSPSPDATSSIEARLRHALHVVAQATPTSDAAMPSVSLVETPVGARPPRRSPDMRWRLAAAAALLVVIVGVAAVLVSGRGGSRVDLTPADGNTAPNVGTTPQAVDTIPADLSPVVAPDHRSQDHWHAAYGFYLCDTFLAPLSDTERSDDMGIHTHGDGLIHIHPFGAASSGPNARLGLFGDQVGVRFTKDGFTLPDGGAYRNGSATCNGQPATIAVYRWSVDEPASPNDTTEAVFTENFDRITFAADRQAYTIAVLPAGTTPPKPPSIPELDRLTDVVASSSSQPAPTGPGSTPSMGTTQK